MFCPTAQYIAFGRRSVHGTGGKKEHTWHRGTHSGWCCYSVTAHTASAHQPWGHRAPQASRAGGDRQRSAHQKEKQRKVHDGPRSALAIFKSGIVAKIAQLLQSSRDCAEAPDP